LREVPANAPQTVELYHGDLAQLLGQLESEGHRRAYVDGGRTINSFLRAGLLTDLIITTIPILLGAGRPLFGPLPADVHLRLRRSTAYSNGLVQSEFEIVQTAP
jgi:dihydrofolate reductase